MKGEFKHGWYDGEGKVIQYHDKRVSGSRNEYEGGFWYGFSWLISADPFSVRGYIMDMGCFV